MNVLMTTDGSKHATIAMRSAARLLRRDHIHIDVLSVGPEMAGAAGVRSLEAFRKHVETRTRHILGGAQKVLSEEGFQANAIPESGSPLERILERSANYDLLVAGAYGRGERSQPGLGPVSSRLVQHGGRRVFIGHELVNDKTFRVLVALDGSSASWKALETLEQLFDITSCDVTLMHIVEVPWAQIGSGDWLSSGEDTEELSTYEREMTRELRAEADAIIDKALRHVERRAASVSTIIEEGDPALELNSHLEEGGYDLVAVGATGSADLKHVLVGSVSLKLAWNAPCSVLIVNS